jgi:hypothetical protein
MCARDRGEKIVYVCECARVRERTKKKKRERRNTEREFMHSFVRLPVVRDPFNWYGSFIFHCCHSIWVSQS